MLSRLKQVALLQETREDVAQTDAALFVAANMAYSAIDPVSEFDLQTFERNIARDTLTPLRGLTGMKMGRIRFGLEMAGSTTAFSLTDATYAGLPEFDLPLRACGFRRSSLLRIPMTVTTGNLLRHGDVVTQSGSSATATVVGDTYLGQGSLWVTQGPEISTITPFTVTKFLGSGTIATGSGATTWTGTTASETPAPAATQTGALAEVLENDGVGWWPYSFAISTLETNASGIVVDIPDGTVLKCSSSWWIKVGTQVAVATNNTKVFVRRLTGHRVLSTAVTSVDGVTTYFTTSGNTNQSENQTVIPSLTMGALHDGVREALSGARGSVRIRCNIGEPAIMEFEFRGKQKSFTDGGLIPGVSYTQALPPVILDADYSVGTDALTFAQEAVPNVAGVEFDMAQQVEFRKSIDASGGLLEAHIIGKRPTFTMDPEVMPEGFFSWMANFTGNTNVRARMRVGTTNQSMFLLTSPGMAITSSGLGDRDGFQTRQVQGMLTSGSQGTSSVLKDNELVIIYQVS